MPRGSGGGGRRSYSSRSSRPAPPSAPRQQAAAPAPAAGSLGTGGGFLSSIADAWVWGASASMAHRAMDAVFGPRKFEIEHTATPAAAAPAAGAPPSSPCDVHALAFQDCINHNGSDISRCQFYVDILNDCRRNGQVAVVQASG